MNNIQKLVLVIGAGLLIFTLLNPVTTVEYFSGVWRHTNIPNYTATLMRALAITVGTFALLFVTKTNRQ